MAVTLTVGQRQRKGGTFQSSEAISQSTATAAQALSVTTDISTLAGGTATGLTRNRVSLAAGVEGQDKVIVNLATGETWVDLTGGTATNFRIPLRRTNSYLNVRYINEGWRVTEGSVASEHTATGVTSTGLQTIPRGTMITFFDPGTSTGATVNRWLLDDDSEGTWKYIYCTGTGELYVQPAGGTATGALVFGAADDNVLFQYLNGGWKVILNTGATIATATAAS